MTWRKVRRGILSGVMIALACLVGVPLYYILVNTFKTQAEMSKSPLALPSQLVLSNYEAAFGKAPVLQSFGNTLFVTVVSVVLMIVIGSMAAYGMLMRNSKFNAILATVLLVGFIIPTQSTIIPIYRMLAQVGLVNTLTGLALVYSGGAIFCYFLIQGYMRTIPIEVIEAARIDGAGPWQIYWRIALPLIRPILMTVGVFQTMWVWNDFINANVFLGAPGKQTLVLLVYQAVGQYTTNWPIFMTLTVIVLIPMVIFFIFAQRQIVAGLVAGSVKG